MNSKKVHAPAILAAPRIELRRKAVRRAITSGLRATWDYIACDFLSASPRRTASARDVRDAAADYYGSTHGVDRRARKRGEPFVSAKEACEAWGRLSLDEQEAILAETFPRGACL